MVAESVKPPTTQGKQAQFGPGNRIPEAIRLTVRSLYLNQGFGPATIGPMVSLSTQQVRNMVMREGWTTEKSKRVALSGDRKAEMQAKLDARASQDVQRVVEAVAIRSEELSVRSLDYCSELLDAKDPKGLQMASGAARNFVQIARMSRGLDRREGNGSSQDAQLNVNLFLVRGETLDKPIQAEAIPVSATPLPVT